MVKKKKGRQMERPVTIEAMPRPDNTERTLRVGSRAINNQFDYPPVLAAAVPRDNDQESLDWQRDALCAQTDPEAFFPEQRGSTRDAKRICQACDARAECLDYALQNDERFGIWGGLSERERRKLKRRA